MICLRCDNEEFVTKPDEVIRQEFRNELLEIRMSALACSKCGWVTVDLDQAEELRRRTADAYRKKHGFLTSDAIKAIRNVLGQNQCEFAAFLRVGEASVKRWETWLVQEKGNDELIRLKFDQHIREQLDRRSAWISFNYDALIEAGNGVTIQPVPSAMVLKPSLWEINADFPKLEQQSQMSLFGSDQPLAAGLSPPRTSDSHFLFQRLRESL